MNDCNQHPASFRDPAGFVFLLDGHLYRQVNVPYAEHYLHFIQSGLYQKLLLKEYIIPHTEIRQNFNNDPQWLITLKPGIVAFISYPYEWSFDMLKDAALLTLQVNLMAMQYGMILKDATPFNIQFYNGKPIFIDTLSFEKHDETKPWIAYRQFCEMFLYPLLLSHYLRYDVQQLLQIHINGLPFQVAANMLGWRGSLNFHVLMHVRLPGLLAAKKNESKKVISFSRSKMFRLMENLEQAVKNFSYNPPASSWHDYYDNTISSREYLQNKEQLVRAFLEKSAFQTIIDAGANDGFFSKIAAEKGAKVIAIDNDGASINRLYRQCRKAGIENILPLFINLINPPGGIGWHHTERTAFMQRAKAEMVMALALIHHLALTNNIPFRFIAAMFSQMASHLIIEFVPKTDPKVQLLLAHRPDSFAQYTLAAFEETFSFYYHILEKKAIGSTDRVLYFMRTK